MARGRGVGWEPVGAAAQAAEHRLVLELGIGGGEGVDSLQICELVQTLVCPSPTNGTGSSLWGGWSDEIPTPLALLLFSGCG